MAEEKAVATPTQMPKKKTWRYVGPGSASRSKEDMPDIGNLPIDIKRPSFGYRPGTVHADELPEKYIEYVMRTNKETAGWWVEG